MLLALSAVSNSTTYASAICNSTTYDSAISNSAITTYLPSPSSPRVWKIIVCKTNIVQLLMGSNKQVWCFNGWLAINCVLSQSRICCNLHVFDANLLWPNMHLCYLNHFLQLCKWNYQSICTTTIPLLLCLIILKKGLLCKAMIISWCATVLPKQVPLIKDRASIAPWFCPRFGRREGQAS